MTVRENSPEAVKTHESSSLSRLLIRAAIRLIIAFAIWSVLLFLPAGTVVWPRGWFHVGLWLATFLVNLAVLSRLNRDVLVARLSRQRSTEHEDTIILLLFLPAILAIPVVAGLDAVRYQWTTLPSWTVYPAFVLHVGGDILLLWTMVVNPFLEKVVRVQSDRGHRVITTGPYALVRHPMYLAVTLMFLAIPLTLGSAWTFVPVAVMTLLLMYRTGSEERLLRRHLAGYEDYMTNTKWRILPGIW